MQQMCRLVVGKDGKARAEGIDINNFKDLPIDLQNLINEDKKYGKILPPANGWITYKVYDGDKEMNREDVEYLVRIALGNYQRKFDIKFRPAKDFESAMLKISFTDPQHDKNMTGSTLAYHYYPYFTEKRGICRINRNYYYTVHGRRLNLSIIDPEHYPDPTKAKEAPTWDLDQILIHEFGHGIFGLQHDGQSGTTMSATYQHMTEFLDERTIKRIEAKGYKKRGLLAQWKEQRLEKWLKARAEHLPIWVEQ